MIKGTIKWKFNSVEDAILFESKLKKQYKEVYLLADPESESGWYVWGVKND